jgi:hypothetical protein
LTTVYNYQYYWVFRLRPPSGILRKPENTTFRKMDLFPSSSVRLALSKGPNRVGVLWFLEYRTMDEDQKRSNSEICRITDIFFITDLKLGARGSVVVKALSYKSEGRGIESR